MRPRVIVVAKRSAYTHYVEEQRDRRVGELVQKQDPSVRRWRAAHQAHQKTVKAVERELERLGAKALILRKSHAVFDASSCDLVVTVGGDGTLLAASHHVSRAPMLAVNSSPKDSVGFFCAVNRAGLREALEKALLGKLTRVELARMEVEVNGSVRSRRVLNEALCCHTSPAHTSRYIVRYGRINEQHRSSGFWIGPPAGSTAALRSAGGRILPLTSQQLQFVVREPYVPAGEEYRLSRFLAEPGRSVKVQIKMHDAALYLDGPHLEYRLRLGDQVVFRLSKEPLTLLGLSGRRRTRAAAAE
ncbi:MAG: NAD(+)/NADH kinase [Polyangiaceae bacterium]|nr:NAD(+)/NADH kinase [Myxococcales bacterium]MCB9588039.1 NAD(+)/NADH kinase [Polyangiaceae bacterium]MCB9610652.1 NAD(+)/NADH kinase [Polyangiaceae bacterium]